MLADVAATAERMLAAGAGLGSCFHAAPFHRKIRVLPPLVPTAQALLADVAATPDKLPAGAGLGTRFHAVPFHRTISGLGLLLVVQLLQPTAQALLADVAATPDRLLPVGSGLDTVFQAIPFHRRIRALPPLVPPTAQALLAEVAATPDRRPLAAEDPAGPRDPAAAAAAITGETPATTPASSSGTARTLTERVIRVIYRCIRRSPTSPTPRPGTYASCHGPGLIPSQACLSRLQFTCPMGPPMDPRAAYYAHRRGPSVKHGGRPGRNNWPAVVTSGVCLTARF